MSDNPPANPPAKDPRDLPLIGGLIGTMEDWGSSLKGLKDFSFGGMFNDVINGTLVGAHTVNGKTVGGHREGAHPELAGLNDPNTPWTKKIGLAIEAAFYFVIDLVKEGGGALKDLFSGLMGSMHTQTPEEKTAADNDAKQASTIKTAENGYAQDKDKPDATPPDPAVVAAKKLQAAQDALSAQIKLVAGADTPTDDQNKALVAQEQAVKDAAKDYLKIKLGPNADPKLLDNAEVGKFQTSLVDATYSAVDTQMTAAKKLADAESKAMTTADVVQDFNGLAAALPYASQHNTVSPQTNADFVQQEKTALGALAKALKDNGVTGDVPTADQVLAYRADSKHAVPAGVNGELLQFEAAQLDSIIPPPSPNPPGGQQGQGQGNNPPTH